MTDDCCTLICVDANALLPEISAVTCIPSTSKQSPKFTSQLSSPLGCRDAGNRAGIRGKPAGKCDCQTLFLKVDTSEYS